MHDLATDVPQLLQRFRGGDHQAKCLLIAHARRRFARLTRRMLRNFPALRRWEETDDVLQQSMINLEKALKAKVPESAEHFYNLATRKIRQELINLLRHHMGPQGHGAKHHTDSAGRAGDGRGGLLDRLPSDSFEPENLELWAVFHESVGTLPFEERQVAELHWYGGLTHEAASVVLNVSNRTVKRRWQSARLKLAQQMR